MKLDRLCILVVEDDPNDALLYRRAFAKIGLTQEVPMVSDGQDAIDYLLGEEEYSDRDRHPIPDLLITDLKMPRKSGLELLEWIRRCDNFQTIRRVVLSSSSEPADIRKAYESLATSYFCKPTEFDNLVRLLRTILEYWNACRLLPDT